MPQLLETIQNDLKSSLKGGERDRVGALRFIISQIQYARIEKQAELEDADVLRVLKKQAKNRKESIEAFRDAGRLELLAKEEMELSIIEEYLPDQIGEDEVREVLRAVITDEELKNMADMGHLMKNAMQRLQERADGNLVSQLAKEELQRLSD